MADPICKNIFKPNYSVTGIRQDMNDKVLMTGSYPSGGNQGLIYLGNKWPTDPTSNEGYIYLKIPNPPSPPNPPGTTVKSSIFYGPNTQLYNSNNILGTGSFRVVGSYITSADNTERNHGVMYTGPKDNSGKWVFFDYARSGWTTLNTIPHSTMGDLVVGDYELQSADGKLHEFGAFVYKMGPGGSAGGFLEFKLSLPGKTITLVTAYGIWQNGPETSTKYTIAGGLNDGSGSLNVAYVVDYDSSSQTTSNLTTFPGPTAHITHFEGITSLGYPPHTDPQIYSLAATGDPNDLQRGAAYAEVKRASNNGPFNPQSIRWVSVACQNATGTTTGNTVLEYNLFGIFKSTAEQSYMAPIP